MKSSNELQASYTYVEDAAQLEKLLTSFQGDRIGIDTEFIRTDTFYPKSPIDHQAPSRTPHPKSSQQTVLSKP